MGEPPYKPYTAKDGTWAVYWYICGSDLELRDDLNFTPTGQIQEMLSVTLPDNVTAVLEVGGAKRWHNSFVDPDVINRFVYRGDTLTQVETKPLANMGDGQTLAEFLEYCNLNYPAEHQVVVIYDHGGGSTLGVAFDDLYNMEPISLPELEQAFAARPAASGTYELVGLSACLMSTIDAIGSLEGQARYLVASEESQLGCSWDYSTLFSAIALDTTIDGAALGKAIANGYAAQCKHFGYTAYTTLSVIDLAYASDLVKAYNDVGNELLQGVAANGVDCFANLGRAAYISENYGANDSPTSCYDMVDLGNLVTNARELLPNSAEPMLQAINKAVIYHVTNPLRADGLGISCYFPYTGSLELFEGYTKLEASPAFRYYYDYAFNGSLSEEGRSYLASLSAEVVEGEAERLPSPSELGLDGCGISLHGNGTYWLELEERAAYVSAVYLRVGIYDQKTGDMILLGTRDDIYKDWELGLFADQFDVRWGSLDGALCYMEAVGQAEDKLLYRVPVYHNGVPKNLMVAYSGTEQHKSNGSYQILGLLSTNDSESPSPNPTFENLKTGDVIEPILYRLSAASDYRNDIGGPGEPMTRAITVTKGTRFYDTDLGDGLYFISFEIIDYSATRHYSKSALYVIENGIFNTAPQL
jgi:hypothetical protein